MWNCVPVGMAQTKHVVRVGRRAERGLRSSPNTSLNYAARCAVSEPPATGARAFHIKPLALDRLPYVLVAVTRMPVGSATGRGQVEDLPDRPHVVDVAGMGMFAWVAAGREQ